MIYRDPRSFLLQTLSILNLLQLFIRTKPIRKCEEAALANLLNTRGDLDLSHCSERQILAVSKSSMRFNVGE